MITDNITVIHLQASEELWLVKEEGEEKTFCKEAFLGPFDSPENWREATQEEKDAYDEMVRTRMEEEYEAIDSESV